MNATIFLVLIAILSIINVESWSFAKNVPVPAQKVLKNIATVAGAINIALLATGSPAFADSVPAIGKNRDKNCDKNIDKNRDKNRDRNQIEDESCE